MEGGGGLESPRRRREWVSRIREGGIRFSKVDLGGSRSHGSFPVREPMVGGDCQDGQL